MHVLFVAIQETARVHELPFVLVRVAVVHETHALEAAALVGGALAANHHLPIKGYYVNVLIFV